ncbi:hypothetical protein ABEB36_012711 [Hypothenemus hampei]|uniref:Myb/SANT-like DNA-binding domain-containing protein n=1 Tax=Hypothenemus hampei TaxID=57062 RepID=A0ABD1EEW7_HYPHA
MCEIELSEFMVFRPSENEDAVDPFKWSHNATLMFLNLYKDNRKQVGTLELKNIKKLFEKISKELKHQLQLNITPANCENRWKHLERMYKKYIDNNKKTGRGRKSFEYAEIMEDILGKKKISTQCYYYLPKI